MARGHVACRGVDVAGLVVEEEVGLELAQEFALGQAAEEHGFVDADVPLHQRADRALVRGRAACGDQRGVFTQGRPPFGYLRPLRAHLFLSVNAQDVREALNAGFPAARVLVESVKASDAWPNEVRIAFDGDAVLFSDEAERVFQAEGLDAFQAHELSKADLPLPEGPFKPLLMALHRLQMAGNAQMRIRTARVTARRAPAHERAIRTLMKWNIRVDEAMFLGGLPKGEFLREFEPDFFFDDQTGHVDAASRHVPAGHVSSGISNEP